MSSATGRSPPAKKENKLKKGKREGTPEKGPEEPKEEVEVEKKRPVIFDDEIAKLKITDEDLLKAVTSGSVDRLDGGQKAAVKVAVRKEIPEKDRRPPMKKVGLLKRAPPNAPVVPFEDPCNNGPRINDEGKVVPHSILGSLDDYYRMALNKGDMQPQDIPPAHLKTVLGSASASLPVKERAARQVSRRSRFPHKALAEEENAALKNWEAQMRERKRQQGYISKLLQRPPDELAMNSGESYRKTQEERYLIDRTIPFLDYGKGFRVGSEYWKQQEVVGDEETGLQRIRLCGKGLRGKSSSMTLTQTEKGYPPAIEHIGIPSTIKIEKGIEWERTKTPRYPWKFPYYVERRRQLSEVMAELDPHQPCFNSLEIIGERVRPATAVSSSGTTRPESRSRSAMESRPSGGAIVGDDTYESSGNAADDVELPSQILGPSLLFGGQPVRWTGDSFTFEDAVGVEARVIFQCHTADKCKEHLEIVNDGTTVVHYDWKKLPKSNPFDLVQPQVRRFYFNTSSGVLLPGERLSFPFLFKSEKAGLFTEQWQLVTRPVLCGGAALVVTLRGIALQEDVHAGARSQIEADLRHNAAARIVRSILLEILSGLQQPERPKTPTDAYKTEEEEFCLQNPQFSFTLDAVNRLQTMHNDAPSDSLMPWDLSISGLRETLLAVEAETNSTFSKKEEAIRKFQTYLAKIGFNIPRPRMTEHTLMYQTGYRLLIETLDTAFNEWQYTRQVMGLPEMELEFPDPTVLSQSRCSTVDALLMQLGSTPPIPATDAAHSFSAHVVQEAVVALEEEQQPVVTFSVGKRSSGLKLPPKAKKRDRRKGTSRDVKSRATASTKDGKSATASRSGKEGPSRPETKAGGKSSGSRKAVSGQRPATGGSERPVESSPVDPALGTVVEPIAESAEFLAERRAHNTIYCQTYALLVSATENMADIFSHVESLGLPKQ